MKACKPVNTNDQNYIPGNNDAFHNYILKYMLEAANTYDFMSNQTRINLYELNTQITGSELTW